MSHGTSTEWANEKSEGFKTKVGLIMFAIYAPIYFIFILISIISPRSLATDVGSLNLAIVYGFGLIIVAIIQALIYNAICSNKEKEHGDQVLGEGDNA